MRTIVGLALLLLTAGTVGAQTRRPRIGLALEGGGALGLAHVGVLEALEKLNVPIDYIAGTSMGALVAGIYATGKRPAEISTLIRGIDWDRVLRGETEYRTLIYRRKEDRRAYPNLIEFGLRDGLSFSAGLNSGEEIGLILDEVSLPYSLIKSFDDLPIPFRCVGTELTEGRTEVFRDGSLSEALRATMAIPAFFTPAPKDGKVYSDGGLLNNLPVDILRDMGADIIIAVHLQVQGFTNKDLSSPVAALNRSISVVIAVNERRSIESLQKADVLITVPLQEFTSVDYTRYAEMMTKGSAAANAKEKLLKLLALTPEQYASYRAGVEARRIEKLPAISFVEVQGTKPALSERIQRDFLGNAGAPPNPERLKEDARSVTGIGRFSNVNYALMERQGQTGLLVKTREKAYAPPTVLAAPIIDGSDFNNVQFSIGARLTYLDVGSYRSEWRNDAQVGSVYSLSSEYYRPFRPNSTWFVAPSGFAYDRPVSLYDDGERVAEYRTRALGGAIDIGSTRSRFSEFRAGYRLSRVTYSRRIGDPALPSLDGSQGVASVRFITDHLDDPIIPRAGYFLQGRFEFWDKNIGALQKFSATSASYAWARPVSPKGSIFFNAAGGTTFGADGTGLPIYNLGGALRMVAYGQNEFFTNQFIYGRASYLHQIATMPVIVGKRIFLIGTLEAAKPYGVQSTRLPANAAAGVLLETLIGPVFFGGATGDSGHHKFYFQIGRFF